MSIQPTASRFEEAHNNAQLSSAFTEYRYTVAQLKVLYLSGYPISSLKSVIIDAEGWGKTEKKIIEWSSKDHDFNKSRRQVEPKQTVGEFMRAFHASKDIESVKAFRAAKKAFKMATYAALSSHLAPATICQDLKHLPYACKKVEYWARKAGN